MIFSFRSAIRSLASALFFCLVLVSLESAVRADLNPGDSQYNPVLNGPPLSLPPATFPPYTPGPLAPTGYTIPVDSFNSPLTFIPANYPADAYNGSVTSNVFKNLAGQLAFSYVFNNLPVLDPLRENEITRATIGDPSNPWAGVKIIQTGADGSGLSHIVAGPYGWIDGNPFQIQRDGVGVGSGVGVWFNQVGLGGTELDSATSDRSAVIWLTTNATQYRRTDVGLIDHGVSGVGHAFGPVVPEPSTLVLAAAGGLTVVFMARRNRQRRTRG